jgi:uncharacterized membrane protein YdcZ (DUF606 family)
MALGRRNLIALLVVDVVLFVLAGVTSGKNSKHPGTVSNIFWWLFLIGVLALIVLCVVALVVRLRQRSTA